MEIRSIKNEKEVSYPKSNEISDKTLKRNIPKKWRRIGLTSLVLIFVMKSCTFAKNDSIVLTAGFAPSTTPTAGVVQTKNPILLVASAGIGIIAVITFLISLIAIIKTKIKAKKENEKVKVKIIYKIMFIISIILIIASIIGIYCFNNC